MGVEEGGQSGSHVLYARGWVCGWGLRTDRVAEWGQDVGLGGFCLRGLDWCGEGDGKKEGRCYCNDGCVLVGHFEIVVASSVNYLVPSWRDCDDKQLALYAAKAISPPLVNVIFFFHSLESIHAYLSAV